MITIQEGALFLSDAHENPPYREGFFHFLRAVEQGEIKTSQLFFMGDMFDLLIGEIDYTRHHNRDTIDLINRLCERVEIFYFEGNHDYNLRTVFPKITVFPIRQQPVSATFHDRKLLLSHGDWCEEKAYLRYTQMVRNPLLLKPLNLLDKIRHNAISSRLLTKLSQKNICRKLPRFHDYIKQKIQKYDIGISKIDFVCEGHYHQNVEYRFHETIYRNFSSFACEKSYYQITFQDRVVFKEVRIRG